MSDKRDLIIHYDEDAQKIIFYSVAAGETTSLRDAAFDGVCPEVGFFKEKTPNDAEMAMGGMVFSLLDLGSLNKIGIRDYAAESEAAMQEWVNELEVGAKNNDPDAQFSLFIEYHSRALKSCQLTDLQRAEDLLFAADKGGSVEARKVIDDWPLMKAAAERRIQRGPSV